MLKRTLWVCALVSSLLTRPVLSETALFIDFESFPGPDGILGTLDDVPAPACPDDFCYNLSTEYASLGLVFQSGTLFQADFFPAETGNHFISSSPLDVTLTRDAHFVSIESFSSWTAVLWAFDGDGQLIDTAILAPQGDRPETLSLSSTVPIRRFTVRAQGCEPDVFCSQILNVDNLRLSVEDPEPPAGDWLTSAQVPGFRFKVRLTDPQGVVVPTRQEPSCLPQTLCVSGAVAGRTEVLARVVGPRPNGHLWSILAKLTPSRAEAWIEQSSTGVIRYYVVPGGLFDRYGFLP